MFHPLLPVVGTFQQGSSIVRRFEVNGLLLIFGLYLDVRLSNILVTIDIVLSNAGHSLIYYAFRVRLPLGLKRSRLPVKVVVIRMVYLHLRVGVGLVNAPKLIFML